MDRLGRTLHTLAKRCWIASSIVAVGVVVRVMRNLRFALLQLFRCVSWSSSGRQRPQR